METKELIQEAALDLFSRKGFDSSSVRDIAAQIGIKDSSLYFHFKSKQAILDSLMDRFIHISRQMMEGLDEGKGEVRVDEALKAPARESLVRMLENCR